MKTEDIYGEALQQFQSYVGDAVATIERALVERPDYVRGHAFRAGALMTFGEQRYAEAAKTSVEAAERLVGRASDNDRGLVAAIRKLVDGDWDAGCRLLDRVLVDYPRDAFTLQVAHLFDFFRGDALNLRNRIERVLPAWSEGDTGYSYLLGMHAFGLEECNQYDEADEAAQRALALQPKDGWAVHAAVHVREMKGKVDDGIALLEQRKGDWAPDNGFAYHNWWHLALFHLDRSDLPRVLELFDRSIYPERSDISFQLVDATALLWRLFVLGENVGTRWEQLADAWTSKLDAERGFYAFNDAHAMMAFAATRREDAAARLLRDMEAATAGRGSNAMMTREVGLPVVRGLIAFAQGKNALAVEELLAVRDGAYRFGGSHAQRDLITLTLIVAAQRAGQHTLARHFLAERLVQRPGGGLGARLAAR